MFAEVMTVVCAVPGGHGLGVFYWDATWTVLPGNGWAPPFCFEGRAIPVMGLFAKQ